MIDTICATKKGMSQIWDAAGKRIAITKFFIEPNIVVGKIATQVKADKTIADSLINQSIVEIGYGEKKLKNVAKPMQVRLSKLNLKKGVKTIIGIRETAHSAELNLGQTINFADIFSIGSLVQVQGKTKGRGFAGGMKRHHFRGGPKTHGQSDRARAVGSVGNRTTPGRVWPGKRLPGHYGLETTTVTGLTVVYLDPDTNQLWLSGPVPGAYNSTVIIKATGKMNKKFKPALTQTKENKNDSNQQTSAPKAEVVVKETNTDKSSETAKEKQS